MGKFSAAWGWGRNNYAVIVAISSTIIAVISLDLTIEAQRLDREYKELAIRPSLAVNTSSSELKVTLINLGIGPAVIKRVAIDEGQKCYEVSDTPEAKSHFLQLWISIFSGPIMTIWSPKDVKSFDLVIDVLTPGIVIPANVTRILADLNQDAKAHVEKLLDEKGARLKFSRAVEDATGDIPIAIEWCSISGKFCSTFNHRVAEKCWPKKQ